jgi:hypothetical protein
MSEMACFRQLLDCSKIAERNSRFGDVRKSRPKAYSRHVVSRLVCFSGVPERIARRTDYDRQESMRGPQKASVPLGLKYHHVDVFSSKPLSGNGVTVFQLREALPTDPGLQH